VSWTNVKLIYFRELRDQLRDRRTMFTIVVLPVLLYPLLGLCLLQVQQFLREHSSQVRLVGTENLPPAPALLADGQFASDVCDDEQRRLLAVTAIAADKSAEDAQAAAQRDIAAGLCDAVVYFPPDFARRLAAFRQAMPQPDSPPREAGGNRPPEPVIFHDTASEKSKLARERLVTVLQRWREKMVEENLRHSRVPVAAARPFEIKPQDVAEESRRRAAVWSKILPFILMVWALTGAFYPAIDMCAGEKERGTLETLLSSPAQRSEIVWGKLLTVMTFSMAMALLNLAITAGMATFVITRLDQIGPPHVRMHIGSPPLAALFWLALALPPVSALFSALSLAVAAFARSSKEGQYYLMPLLMLSLPLMLLPMLPQTELDLGFALIPISGLMLLLRKLIEGQYLEALRYSVPVIAVTGVCCLLAIRWAVDQFNNESVLFRESERLDLGLWLKHLVRDRQETPSVGEAVLCGVVLLVIRFFSNFVIAMPQDWPQFVTTTLILQIALIATPACLMAIMLTRRPAKTLSLGRPSFLLTLPAAVLLAACLHPAMLWLNEGIRFLYPLSPAVKQQLQPFAEFVAQRPPWELILLIGLTPAICEELAFRGFILSGLRRMGHKWGAIVLASIFFGLAHGLLQQSLAACCVGIIIGYIVVKTGSLWTGVLYHFTHNSLAVLHSRVTPDLDQTHPLLRLVLAPGFEEGTLLYSLPATIALGVVGVGLAWWLKSLPYHQSAEERLQAALDHQVPLPAKSPA
jgi:sodium transport system permease protein